MARPRWTGRQFHNQPAESHQHRFLAALWHAVGEETDGQVEVTVHPRNGGMPGSDPAVLEMLRRGEVEFFTLMGGILGKLVPVAEIQGLPFAFASHAQVHAANDGPLGAYIGRECAAKGLYRLPRGLLENGFRHISLIDRPVRSAEDLVGVRLRIPDGQMYRDLFTALEAQPVTVNISEIYEALETRRVDGHENPLVIMEVNKLYEVTRHVSLTSHMWSGFNLLANLAYWQSLPELLQGVIERNVTKQVALQRAYTDDQNNSLADGLGARGMVFNLADTASFRRKLGGDFFQRWRRQFGETAWALLEAEAGQLG